MISESDFLLNKIISENVDLKHALHKSNNLEYLQSGFLKTLVAQSKKKYKNYTDNLKYISVYLFLVGGRLLYETLQLNLPLPSVHTVLKFLNDSPSIVEGELRSTELARFLVENNYKNQIWLSEDATKIVSRIKYNSKTNNIIGLVLPLNNETGMPELNKFVFENVEKVQQFIDCYQKSEYAECFMAQSFCDGAVAFCVCLFGTNNKFKSEDVTKRVKFIQTSLKLHDIEVYGEI